MSPELAPTLTGTESRYGRVNLIEPSGLGYVHLAASVQPRSLPFLPKTAAKSKLLARVKHIARDLEGLDSVVKATVYDALVFPPPSGYVRERARSVHMARFDIVVLIEALSPEAAKELTGTPPYREIVTTLRSGSTDLHEIVARNIKRVGDVDKTRKGTFLSTISLAMTTPS